MKFHSHTPTDDEQDDTTDDGSHNRAHRAHDDTAALGSVLRNESRASRLYDESTYPNPPTVATGMLDRFPDDAQCVRYDPDVLRAWGETVAAADGEVNVAIVPMEKKSGRGAGGATLMLVAKPPGKDEVVTAAPIVADDGGDLLAPGEETTDPPANTRALTMRRGTEPDVTDVEVTGPNNDADDDNTEVDQ